MRKSKDVALRPVLGIRVATMPCLMADVDIMAENQPVQINHTVLLNTASTQKSLLLNVKY